ncbi:EAL domain-containing protein [Bacillus solitudinis]|uniref:EAL domain-containing protein n=1 Tax=Bacillus solitudinis TaxID=2014074 RepID=UPI000C23A1C4|nr:EAL domain-containing protein [Bacillus solitudinis]
MDCLFVPAKYIMCRLSYRQKFSLLGFLLILSAGVAILPWVINIGIENKLLLFFYLLVTFGTAYFLLAYYYVMYDALSVIKNVSERVLNENFSSRVNPSSRDEVYFIGPYFNEMIATFNRMAYQHQYAQKKIEHLANYDPLTGLANRSLFQSRLPVVMEQARKSASPMAILCINLDRFKMVNDTMGHRIGDELLKALSCKLTIGVGKDDMVARLGGDEFNIILTNLSSECDARNAAKRIIAEISQPVVIEECELSISCSIGISMYPNHSESEDLLLRYANRAMYFAKEKGKATYQLFDSSFMTEQKQKFKLEMNLKKALEKNQFFIQYQPRVETRNGEVVGFESLIRWMHPDLGIIRPNEFIPLAEKSSLIFSIGYWVLRTACLQTKEWQRKGFNPGFVSVNISPNQFLSDSFVSDVKHILEETNLEPYYLELELTEHVFCEDNVINKLKQLKKIGVRIAIDDFGTGFSSLSYLKNFPIDTLKIDRTFIKDIPSGEKDKAIMKTIISMGRRLNLCVVAEGVETIEQLQFLEKRGSIQVQGYLISRPVVANEYEDFLRGSERIIKTS